ncbi:MAG: YceI family protein [Saprospiraceae bacterium]
MQKLMIFCAAFFVLSTAASAQNAQKFFTRDAKIKFSSDTPMEKIEGLSNSATCILDPVTGDMAWQVLIKGFKFEKTLMQEHFNENYMESDKFPKATFSGKITNLGEVNLAKDGTYNAAVSGKMTIHGVTKDFSTNGAITVGGGQIRLNAGFNVPTADYDIKIPSVVRDNIAKEITVLVDAPLAPKQ